MKLIIAGASGFVGREVLQQSLAHPGITSVVAVSRAPVKAPDGDGNGDTSKLQAVLVEDYSSYSADARRAFEGAGACIWTIAITPTKSKDVDFDIVKKVCQTDTMTGLRAIYDSAVSEEQTQTQTQSSKPSSPFRFMYISGVAAERDQTKTPKFMPEYCLMRGETENQVLQFAASQPTDTIEACVCKPGLITDPNKQETVQRAQQMSRDHGAPSVSLEEIAAAMISQCLNGFEKEPLENEDLVRIGQRALEEQKQVR